MSTAERKWKSGLFAAVLDEKVLKIRMFTDQYF